MSCAVIYEAFPKYYGKSVLKIILFYRYNKLWITGLRSARLCLDQLFAVFVAVQTHVASRDAAECLLVDKHS